MANLQKIREACIKANPEIVELKFGCEVRLKVRGDQGVIIEALRIPSNGPRGFVYWNKDMGEVRVLFADDFEILGRPIRLADVLLAIDTQGKSHHEVNGDECFLCSGLWNLRQDDLSLQSEETLNFIASTLN